MAIVDNYTSLLNGHAEFYWNGYSGDARAAFVTYSFESTAPEYLALGGFTQSEIDSVRPFSDSEKNYARDAITKWSSISGITAFEVPAGSGDIRFMGLNTSLSAPGSSGFTEFPYSNVQGSFITRSKIGGDVFIDSTLASSGSDLSYLMLHETGHAFGLKHPFEGATTLTPSLDSRTNTVMSYSGPAGYNQQLKNFDIQAIQAVYGTVDANNIVSWNWNTATFTLTQIDGDDADTILGVAVTDNIIGAGGNDKIAGFEGNDKIEGGGGNDTIFGGEGIDKAIYAGLKSQYAIGVYSGLVSVDDLVSSRDGSDTIYDVERLLFSDTGLAFDVSGNAGSAYRIYQAAFNRTPDSGGLGYWIAQLDNGTSLKSVAQGFIGSAEFQHLYGSSPSNAAFVDSLYHNILHRAGEQGGVDYWNGVLNSGTSKADVLVGFSESAENKAGVIGAIQNGIQYTEWLG